MARKPNPVHIDPLRARAIRHDPDKGWYWRVEVTGANRGTVKGANVWGDSAKVAGHLLDLIRREAYTTVTTTTLKTLGDLMALYLRTTAEECGGVGGRRRGTYITIHCNMKRLRLVDPDLFDVRLKDLTRARVALTAKALLSQYAQSTTAVTITTIYAAWNWGLDEDRAFVGRKLSRIDNALMTKTTRKKHIPAPSDVDATMAELTGWVHLLTRALYETGARIGEIAGLLMSNVDLDDLTITVGGEYAKSDGWRTIPISEGLAAEIKMYRRVYAANPPPRGRLCPQYLCGVHPQKAMSVHSYRYPLRDAIARAGVEYWTPHALRHLAANQLIRGGVAVDVAAALLGHSVEVMLGHYCEVKEADTKAAAAVLRKRNAGVV